MFLLNLTPKWLVWHTFDTSCKGFAAEQNALHSIVALLQNRYIQIKILFPLFFARTIAVGFIGDE